MKNTTATIIKQKIEKDKITMLTAYDYSTDIADEIIDKLY